MRIFSLQMGHRKLWGTLCPPSPPWAEGGRGAEMVCAGEATIRVRQCRHTVCEHGSSWGRGEFRLETFTFETFTNHNRIQ